MRSVRHTRAVPAACLVALLAFAGCSDSKKDDAASTTTSTSAATTATTARPVNTSFTGEGSAEFCGFIASFTTESQTVSPTATPAELEASFRESLDSLDKAEAVAPAEIKPDVEAIADTFDKVEAAASAAGFDLKKVDASSLLALQSPGFLQSVTRLQAYTTNICHLAG
jgi:hypothetical protein